LYQKGTPSQALEDPVHQKSGEKPKQQSQYLTAAAGTEEMLCQIGWNVCSEWFGSS